MVQKMKSFVFVQLLLLGSFAVATLAQQCLPDNERIDCHPDSGNTEAECLQRGCTYCPASIPDQNTPTCFFPRNWGYKMVGEPVNTGHGFRVALERITTSTVFGGDSNELNVEVDFQSDYRLRLKITDNQPRWEVPLKIDPPATNATNPLYDVIFVNEPVFSLKVVRKATGTVIFDSSLGGFNFADQFIQIGFKLPSRNVYGIGENEQHTFRHSFEKRPLFGLWARDQAPSGNANMYGVQPHYTVVENDGNTHSVAIVNSNAQEFEMHPSPGIVYKTLGGVIDMYFFLGPTPENTAQQYSEAVGRYPLPPYWALGFQLCRFGYNNLETMKATVDRMIASEIPFDVQYGDIDIMDGNLDFTLGPSFAGLNDYVKELKTQGLKFMTILDPCVSAVETPGTYRPYELGNEMDVWVKRADGVTPAQGKVWPAGACYFADFSKNSTREWWKILIKEFHDNMLEFDALWIDMNEPANFVDGDMEEGCDEGNSLNTPPYVPRSLRGDGKLYDNTLCPDHVDSLGKHYDTHNIYGLMEAEPTIVATQEAVGKRTFSLSRSSFLGLGRYITHWLGDNFSNWPNMHHSIIGMLQFNLFAIPFVGPDICGHLSNATAQLCQRWQELGAFYPFSRNHNADGYIEQDPAAFNGEIIESTKKALTVRYTLLPYLYSLLARHERWGDTVARPLWSNFPTDSIALGIDRQFMWGSGILITPVLEEDQTTVQAYFPDSRFYDYYTGAEVNVRGNYTTLDAPLDFINVHIHGGSIIVTQVPAINTDAQRNNPFGLILALNDNGEASGSYFYDDGISFDTVANHNYFIAQMSASNKTLNYVSWMNQYPGMGQMIVDTIRLLGASPAPTSITVNGAPHSNFTVLPSGEVLISGLNLTANVDFIMQYN
ncbi:unnamed protein product [Orchesella dallaii]|uniref:P-type domain-containing protein n=1 Tax=Orchesella dallaii TaxID=48710 RepID=A0ABP1Q523_9HEXA